MSEKQTQDQEFPITPEDNFSPDGNKQRIIDGEKAHAMALATDLEETAAAGLRWVAKDALTAGMGEDDFEQTVVDTEVPEYYQEMVKSYTTDDTTDLSPDGIVSYINEEQAKADRKAQFVGEAYDKIKATKR